MRQDQFVAMGLFILRTFSYKREQRKGVVIIVASEDKKRVFFLIIPFSLKILFNVFACVRFSCSLWNGMVLLL